MSGDANFVYCLMVKGHPTTAIRGHYQTRNFKGQLVDHYYCTKCKKEQTYTNG